METARKNLVSLLAKTISDLPHGFHAEVFGGGYSSCMGYVSPQVWGNASYAVHVAISIIDTFGLSRSEVFELVRAIPEIDERDRRQIRGYACGLLDLCMGSLQPKTRRAA